MLERLNEIAELGFVRFLGKAESFKHFALYGRFVDTDGTAAHFVAVQHHVIGAGLGGGGLGHHLLQIAVLGCGEGMVASHIAVFLLAVLVQREVRHPQEIPSVFGDQAELFAEVHAEVAERGVHHAGLARLEEHDVAHGKAEGFGEAGAFLIGQELGDGRLPFVFADLDPREPLRAVDLHELGEFVDLLAGQAFAAGHAHGLHQLGGGEQLEAGVADDGGHVLKLKAETGVGLVHTVAGHGLVPRHAGERSGNVRAERFLEHADHEAFGHVHDLLLVGEAHFDVDLREFRLTVGAEVFVAEAARDLEIAVEPGDHAELLELLRRLRQRVELAVVQTRRNEIVARAFGGRLGEDGRFHFKEALRGQLVADGHGGTAAQREVAGHARAAQVEIAPLEAKVFARFHAVLNLEGRGLGRVQQLPFADHDFHFPGLEVGVDHALGAGAYLALHGKHVFRTQRASLFVGLGGVLGAEHDLRQAETVAQVHKNQAAVVTPVLHPAHEADFRPVVGPGQLTARVGARPVAERLAGNRQFLLFFAHTKHSFTSYF